VLWADQTNSAELLVAQMGAFKAGVQIVTFDEKESIDALNQTLRDSGARGFLFSPQTVISHDENHHSVTR
jgi:acyl-CoA synthetase (AMP-forming)/AMP-acid ligase II